MKLHRFSLILGAALLASACAQADGGKEWNIRIKQDGDSSWSFNIDGPMDYGAAGNRIQGSGTRVERSRSIAPFTKLKLEGSLDVRVSQAAADAVRINADDNVEPLIESRVEGDTLVIRLLPGAGFRTKHAPTVAVDARTLRAIALNGSGDLSLDRFKGEALSLAMSGSGDVHIGQIDVLDLAVDMRGSGDLRVSGNAQKQSWTMAGSGDVDARRLDGRTVSARLRGSGDIDVGQSDTLDVEIDGSGDLSYAGRPQLHSRVNGSGDVNRR